jgi:anti-anti-sigma factor
LLAFNIENVPANTSLILKGLPMSLRLESKLNQDAAVLYCKGELEGGIEAAELRKVVTGLLRERKLVILDLSGIDYMNSGGLSTLVGLYSTARTSGGSVQYVNLSVEIDFARRTPSSLRAA